jgi:hypothetical protein
VIPYGLARDSAVQSHSVASTASVAAKIGQPEFLPPSFMLETQAVGVCTDCGKPLYLRLSRVSSARIDAQVPHFRDGPIGQALKSAKIWIAHPDRPVSCEEIKTPQCGVFFLPLGVTTQMTLFILLQALGIANLQEPQISAVVDAEAETS